jgi:hypothetical protein
MHYAFYMYKGRSETTLVFYYYYKHGESIETTKNYLSSL